MARKKNQAAPREKEKSAAEYYKLNIQAVDDLVNASKENSPPVSQAELKKYHAQRKPALADWLKAVLLKAWFAGIVCYFMVWGLGMYLANQWDLLLVVGVALGIVMDVLENNLYRFYAKTPGANDRWMMFPKKRYITFPLNILYCFLILFCVVMTYDAINAAVIAITGARDTVPLGVGPILFGTFAAAWDLLFIQMKRTAQRMLDDAKRGANAGRKGTKNV